MCSRRTRWILTRWTREDQGADASLLEIPSASEPGFVDVAGDVCTWQERRSRQVECATRRAPCRTSPTTGVLEGPVVIRLCFAGQSYFRYRGRHALTEDMRKTKANTIASPHAHAIPCFGASGVARNALGKLWSSSQRVSNHNICFACMYIHIYIYIFTCICMFFFHFLIGTHVLLRARGVQKA